MCLTAPTTPTYNLKVVGVYTPEVDNITITIKTHDDEFDMDIDPDALANDVFEEYAEKNTIEFAGEELDMELTIEDNGIEDGANISIIAKEEEIDQASIMENTFKHPPSLEDIETRYYRVNEDWWKDDGIGGSNLVYERNIYMAHYIKIYRRTPKMVEYGVFQWGSNKCVYTDKGRIKIDKDKNYNGQGNTEYIGDISSPYTNRYGLRADHLIKGEDIHLFKGVVIHATDGTHHTQ